MHTITHCSGVYRHRPGADLSRGSLLSMVGGSKPAATGFSIGKQPAFWSTGTEIALDLDEVSRPSTRCLEIQGIKASEFSTCGFMVDLFAPAQDSESLLPHAVQRRYLSLERADTEVDA